jgi:class 3 adenylate cyclase/CHASE3 domain sensor protein
MRAGDGADEVRENTAAGADGVNQSEGPLQADALRRPPDIDDGDGSDSELPRFTGPLYPLVDGVARVQASVHTKLLVGFLIGALLLLGMAVLSLVVIDRMSGRVEDLARLHERIDRARQMEYLITAQSHYRAMALLTGDQSNNLKIAEAKRDFTAHLNSLETISGPQHADFFRRVRDADQRFAASSDRVLALAQAGNTDEAMRLHLSEEHPVSHELEAAMRESERESLRDMADAQGSYGSDRRLLMGMVGAFSVVSMASALLLGFVLSWSVIRPVRRIDRALATIAAGNFGHRVAVPNRDEFGTLSRNLNTTSAHLAELYGQLRALNSGLQAKVDEQVTALERAGELRRYLSPQLADSILSGGTAVNLASRRKNLTIFFSDIRNFTAMSERTEPEELVDLLNTYLTEMTEIVFQYGGTLDKYIGDAIMVFFGDPIPTTDHAARAVQMALDMRAKITELQQRWFVERQEFLTVGMGISTGYVTVGNIGSATRLEYTVLGNHVNLASRLAGKARPGQILISERTLLGSRDLVDATEVGRVRLKGVSRPIKIYEIDAKGSTQPDEASQARPDASEQGARAAR